MPSGENDGLRVPGRVVVGQVPRRRARRRPARRRGRSSWTRPPRGRRRARAKTTALPSGVKANSSAPPNGFDGRVGVHRPHQVDRRAARDAAATKRCERRAVVPGVPVADEEPVVDPAGRLCGGRVVEPLARLSCRSAVREDLERQREPRCRRARGRSAPTSSGRSVTCCRLAAVERQLPDLRRARAGREEVDRAAVGRPGAARVGLGSRVSRRRPPPSAPTSQRSVRRLFAARSSDETVNTMDLPSGATRGSDSRSKAIRSRTSKGCGSAAMAAAGTRTPLARQASASVRRAMVTASSQRGAGR